MNFELSDEQVLLRDQSRRFFSDSCPPSLVRRILDGNESYAEGLWRSILEMGFTATVIPEEYGGLGLSYLELVVVAEEIGRVVAPVPFSSSVYLATEALLVAGSNAQKQTWLPKLAAGDVIGTLAYAEGKGQTHSSRLETRASKETLSGFKPVVTDADVAGFYVVLAREEDGMGESLYLVPTGETGLQIEQTSTVDPTRSHAHIHLEKVAAERLGPKGEGWSLLQKILDRAAVLFAWEQLGGAEACLDMAKEYALGRYAFGRSIASYQLVKQKLVEMYVKNTLARSNAYYAAWALNSKSPDMPIAAAAARVGSTQAYAYAAKENIQIHGGMGYTWEFDCQFHYRRSKILAVVIESESAWHEKLITASDNATAA